MDAEAPRKSLTLSTVLCLVLGGGLVYDHLRSIQRAEDLTTQIAHLSKSWHTTSQKLDEQRLVNQRLEQQLADLSQSHPAPLAPVPIEPAFATVLPPAEHLSPDPRLQEVEEERDELSGKLSDVTESLNHLQVKMAETQRRLDASEGNREALLRELKNLQAQKADLELRFYDLSALRQQIHKIRTEQAVSKRLAWIRRGIYGEPKGSELLRTLASAGSPN